MSTNYLPINKFRFPWHFSTCIVWWDLSYLSISPVKAKLYFTETFCEDFSICCIIEYLNIIIRNCGRIYTEMYHVKQFAFIIKMRGVRTSGRKPSKILSFVLILVLMFSISVFIEDAQKSKRLTSRAKSCTNYEKFKQSCHVTSSSTAPALRASC